MEQTQLRQSDLTDDLLEVVQRWSPAFVINSNAGEFARLGGALETRRDQIFTIRLAETRNVFGSVRADRVRYLGQSRQPRFEDALDLIAVLSTHSRIARGAHAALRAPSFWSSVDGAGPRRPVIAVEHLLQVTGYDLRWLQILVAPLARDGALHVMRRDGGFGIALARDIVDDCECARLLRF